MDITNKRFIVSTVTDTVLPHLSGIKTAVKRRAKQNHSAYLQRVGSLSATGYKNAAEANPDPKASAFSHMERKGSAPKSHSVLPCKQRQMDLLH